MANFLQIKADVDYMLRTLAERFGIELEEDRKVREAMEKVKEAGKDKPSRKKKWWVGPASVESPLKLNKLRLIFTRCDDAANMNYFNLRFNDNLKIL